MNDAAKILPLRPGDSCPVHCQGVGMEVADVIEAFALDYHCGNAVRHILGAYKKSGVKGQDPAHELRNAVWYLTREINKLEGRKG